MKIASFVLLCVQVHHISSSDYEIQLENGKQIVLSANDATRLSWLWSPKSAKVLSPGLGIKYCNSKKKKKNSKRKKCKRADPERYQNMCHFCAMNRWVWVCKCQRCYYEKCPKWCSKRKYKRMFEICSERGPILAHSLGLRWLRMRDTQTVTWVTTDWAVSPLGHQRGIAKNIWFLC